MGKRNLNYRLVKIHRSYTVEETAKLVDGRIVLTPWRSAADAGF